MNGSISPEINLARRLINKYSLIPPFKVRKILEKYAEVVFDSIPIAGVDGIAINIKVPGKKPLIIINSEITVTRQNFTMAHELGHLLIPWHTGIKIDNTQENSEIALIYSTVESEANRFAAELLMPANILTGIYRQYSILSDVQREVTKRLKVSPIAAAIQLCRTLEPGIIFCAISNGLVQYSGVTSGTKDSSPVRGKTFEEDWYAAYIHSEWKLQDLAFHWWQIAKVELSPEHEINTSWRTHLDEILLSLPDKEAREDCKRSISGIIGSVNSKLKHEESYSVELLFEKCLQRLNIKEFSIIVNHPLFKEFLQKRLKEMFKRSS